MSRIPIDYMENLINKELAGWTIISALVEAPDREYYGFVVRKGRVEKFVWVLQDPEGNGPGFLNVEKE